MIIGYARTSTIDQMAGFESQITELQSIGCEKVFQEQVSSVGNRVQLDAALEFGKRLVDAHSNIFRFDAS
jgi:DNA invertase Pin-like site-specific DNA recombinase